MKTARGLIPGTNIFVQQLINNFLKTVGHIRLVARQRFGDIVQDRLQGGGFTLLLEGGSASNQLVKHNPERKQVRALVQLLPFGLLR